MPLGDRTGPSGAGPGSGRGLGCCGGYDEPGYLHAGRGFAGFGRARGRGRGYGLHQHRSFAAPPSGWAYPRYAPPTKEESLSALKADAEWLKGQLDTVTKRIEELEA